MWPSQDRAADWAAQDFGIVDGAAKEDPRLPEVWGRVDDTAWTASSPDTVVRTLEAGGGSVPPGAAYAPLHRGGVGDAPRSPPRPLWKRLAFLALACSGCFGVYYGYNIVGATTPALKGPPYDLETEGIGAIMASYSVPNVIAPLFGGAIADRIGVCRAALLFGTVALAGALGLWAAVADVGASPEARLWRMSAAMAVFGVGGESCTVAIKGMLASWFADGAGREETFPKLAFATSAALTFGYAAVVANRWLAPEVEDVADAYRVSAMVCAGSLAALAGAYGVHALDARSRPRDVAPPHALPSKDPSALASLRALPRSFWYLAGTIALASANWCSFETFGTDVLVERWNYSVARANEVSSLPMGSCVVLMPLCGAAYDALSDRRWRIRGAILGLSVWSLSWLGLMAGRGDRDAVPVAAAMGIALGASLVFGGTWPCVPRLVDRRNVGVAFGLVTALQNGCNAAALVGEGRLRDATHSWFPVGVVLAVQSSVAAVLALAVLRGMAPVARAPATPPGSYVSLNAS